MTSLWKADLSGGTDQSGFQMLAQLRIAGRLPHEATFHLLFGLVDADELDRLLGAWLC